MSLARTDSFKSADELSEPVRNALSATLLSLADNKRLLGMRYGEWILGAPTLESGIACSAMAQDEWGHGRILYATLKDFGIDPGALEHERAAADYLSSELLDSAIVEWPDLLALNLLFDAALSVQVEALTNSSYEPIHFKTRKLLEEERFHFEHGRGWAIRLSETAAGRAALEAAFRKAMASSLRWFGRSECRIRAPARIRGSVGTRSGLNAADMARSSGSRTRRGRPGEPGRGIRGRVGTRLVRLGPGTEARWSRRSGRAYARADSRATRTAAC